MGLVGVHRSQAPGARGILRRLTCGACSYMSAWLHAWPEVSPCQYQQAGTKKKKRKEKKETTNSGKQK